MFEITKRFATAAAALVTLTACGGSPAPTESGRQENPTHAENSTPTSTSAGGSQTGAVSQNPCQLLSQGEAAAAAGEPLTEGTESILYTNGCTWAPVDRASTAGIDVALGAPEVSWDHDRQALGEQARPAPKVGEDSYFVGYNGAVHLLLVRTPCKSDTGAQIDCVLTVSVHLRKEDPDQQEVLEVSLAKAALARVTR